MSKQLYTPEGQPVEILRFGGSNNLTESKMTSCHLEYRENKTMFQFVEMGKGDAIIDLHNYAIVPNETYSQLLKFKELYNNLLWIKVKKWFKNLNYKWRS